MRQHQFQQCSNAAHENYMKPLSQISQPRLHRGDAAPVALRSTHPVTDYGYHAKSAEFRGANDRLQLSPPTLSPSFRDLSSDFLATEMKRDYAGEAFFFAIMVGVSAWPIVSMIQALGPLVK
jgi:hypothetical protein